MDAEFCSLEWKKCEPEFVELDSKQRKPSSLAKVIKRQGNRVVYMIPKRNVYILTVKGKDGKLYTEDVYGIIKFYDYNVRITKNFRLRFEEYMRGQSYKIDERMNSINVYNMIEAFFDK